MVDENKNVDTAQVALGLMKRCLICNEVKHIPIEDDNPIQCNLICGDCCSADDCVQCGKEVLRLNTITYERK